MNLIKVITYSLKSCLNYPKVKFSKFYKLFSSTIGLIIVKQSLSLKNV